MNEPLAVLHVALNPLTGPWSVIRHLSSAQMESGLYKGVGVGIIWDNNWPEAYQIELNHFNVPVYRRKTPALFGTASFCYQFLKRPGIERWISSFARTVSVNNIVIHFHTGWMSGVFLPLRSNHDLSLNVVSTFHGVASHFENQPLRRHVHKWMAQRLLKYGAKLTSVDGANPEIAEKLFSLPRDKFEIIPNGISSQPKIACPYLRGREEFLVGHVGLIIDGKGWRIVADAVLAARAKGRNVKFVMAGQGPDESDAKGLSLIHPGAVIYKGFVADPRSKLMPDLDLMAVMSDKEGMPMTIIEAMSIGLPVAATNVGGIPEAVVNGETGRIIERTAERLADVIIELYDNPDLLAKMSERSHEVFLQRFSVDRIVSLYDRLYRREWKTALSTA